MMQAARRVERRLAAPLHTNVCLNLRAADTEEMGYCA